VGNEEGDSSRVKKDQLVPSKTAKTGSKNTKPSQRIEEIEVIEDRNGVKSIQKRRGTFPGFRPRTGWKNQATEYLKKCCEVMREAREIRRRGRLSQNRRQANHTQD